MTDHILPEASSVAGGPSAVRHEDHSGRLAQNALGLSGVLFCIVTGAAPIAAMLFNVPVAVLGGGFAAPAAFLVATIVLTIFAVGYIEMARTVTAAGGFYSFVTHGFGTVMGMGTAALISLCYVIFCSAVLGVTGYFASTSFNEWFSIDIPAWVFMIIFLAIITALSWFHIELTSKILGVFLVTELIGLLIFGFAVLFQGGAEGVSLSPLNPAELFDNTAAIKAFGAGAVGIALFGAFWSWVGFEMAPNYAEESNDPKRIAGIAMYTSVIGLGILYVFISWMFVTGWGNQGAADAVAAQYNGDIASAFYPLTDKYVGSALTTLFEILIVTGLVRVRARLLQHVVALLLLHGPRGDPPARAGEGAPDAPQPVHGEHARDGAGHAVRRRVHDRQSIHAGCPAEARHVEPAARRARHPGHPGARVVRDHPLLPA